MARAKPLRVWMLMVWPFSHKQAIAVIKEQLRVLSDYQPIAAQVYERIQGLRREAYDSSDYLEGLDAFAQKRQPIFRGA